MSEFKLDNFKVDQSSTKEKTKTLPSWHCNLSKNGKLIYAEILSIEKSIQNKIKRGDILKLNERLIIPSQIATKLELHRSTIQKRRHPRLVNLIEEKNIKLKQAWATHGKHRKNNNKTKSDLSKELKALKKQLQIERDKNYSAVISSFLNSDLVQKQAKLAAKVSNLEEEKLKLQKIISNLKVRTLYK